LKAIISRYLMIFEVFDDLDNPEAEDDDAGID
jgi:hypothetical protein